MIIKADGFDIEAFVVGSGPETLVMAAGMADPAVSLQGLAETIATKGLRVVTYNYRTIGASTGSTNGLTLHDYANDLWCVADAVGTGKVHLVGRAFGNRVVRTASQDRPDRALSVILIGAGGIVPPSPETTDLVERYLDPAISDDDWVKLNAQLNYAPGNEGLAAGDLTLDRFPALAKAQMAANDATPTQEWLAGGTAPMLVLTGLMDRWAVPENALSIAKSRRNTWMIGLPDCGHAMINERPDDLSRLICEFVLHTSKQSNSRDM